ncbi:RsmE family RNA methyltransferase [bacterium]|nr:RsmE family RNA methyltransferase [bacterium]
MSSRFFVEGRLKAGTMAFDGPEFHHMIRVTRHQVGDTVRLFDGAGKEADALIEFTSRHSATMKVGKVETIPEEDGPQLILAVAMPKATRGTTLVEKAVELGVSKIVPIRTARGVVDPRQTKLEGFRQNVIAASKQCGRSRLMEVTNTVDWSDFVGQYVAKYPTLVAHPGGVPLKEGLIKELCGQTGGRSKKKTEVPTVVMAIGPEGGFVVEEISQAAVRGGRLVSLGPRMLRIETAAIMVASVFTAALIPE